MNLDPIDEQPVIVCGAGAAGMATAIASARTGTPTWLVESRPQTGGTVAHSLIHTLAGLFDSEGDLLNEGLCRELLDRLQAADERCGKRRIGAHWVWNVDPETYQRVTRNWLAWEPDLRVMTGSRVVGIQSAGGRVEQATIDTPRGTRTIPCRAVVDTTGAGRLAELIEPGLVHDDAHRAAGGLILRIQGVPPGAMAFPKGLGIVRSLRTAATSGELPATCRHAWIDTGIAGDEVYLKLFVPVLDGWRDENVKHCITENARQTAEQVVRFLRRLPEFSLATVAEIGDLGIRDGGRIQGEYVLTADDVRSGRTFEDAACRCAWPIEYWHPETGIQLEAISRPYDIPLRALSLRGWDNAWMAGKCLSADHLAQSSARVVGTCWAMGEAAGQAAALSAERATA